MHERRERIAQHDQDRRTQDGSDERADSADDHGDQDVARDQPVGHFRRDEHRMLRGEHPGQRGERAREDEGSQVIAEYRASERAHAALVLPYGREGAAKWRRDQEFHSGPHERADGDRQRGEHGGVVRVQAERRQIQARNAAHAVGALEGRVAERPGVKHHRYGQRHHDEEHAGHAHHEQADDRRSRRTKGDRQRKRRVRRPAQDDRKIGERVGTDAEKSGVAERHHPGVAAQQIEAHREYGEDRGFGDQRVSEGRRERVPDHRGGEQTHGRLARRNPAPDHRASARYARKRREGISPSGRMTRTAAMTQ